MTQKEAKLLELFEDAYGSPTELADILDLGLEMLFYVEPHTFEQRELQDVVTVLRGMKKLLQMEN